jgi:hypothetical protein
VKWERGRRSTIPYGTLGYQAVLQIKDVYPGSRIRIFSIPDPVSKRFLDPGNASKNLSILTKKNVSKLS